MKEKSFHSALLSVGLVTLALYARTLGFDFINYDDPDYVTENPFVLQGLTWDGVSHAFTSSHAGNWHPLTWLSHMLDVQVFGLNPLGHHLASVLLHVANTLLLLVLLRRMTGSLWKSTGVALLFGVHPLHVESVAWIAERKDVLSCFFWLITLRCYCSYAERPGVARYLVVLASFALGLLAKPMVVTLPLVLLLLDFWPLSRLTRGKNDGSRTIVLRLLSEKVPFLVLGACSATVTYVIQKGGGAVGSFGRGKLLFFAQNALSSYGSYLAKTLWPEKLAVIYPLIPRPVVPWRFWAGVAAFLLVTAAILLAGRKRRYLTVGWLWYVVTLLPVIGFVHVGAQSMADRYTYIPSIGLFVAIVWGTAEISRAWRIEGKHLATCATAVVLTLVIAAHRQVGYWEETTTLFEHAVSVTDDNWVAHYSLGSELGRAGRYGEALYHTTEALKIKADIPGAYNNLGLLYARLGNLRQSVECYREAIRMKPADPVPRLNLAELYLSMGNGREAQAEYRTLQRIAPASADLLRDRLGRQPL